MSQIAKITLRQFYKGMTSASVYTDMVTDPAKRDQFILRAGRIVDAIKNDP